MNENDLFFSRTELLIGQEAMLRMERARVILFGVGGVGSWCAEGLVRSGVRRLTLVDSDRVSHAADGGAREGARPQGAPR